MATKPAITIEGLREFRTELRKLTGDATWTRQLRAANKATAEIVASAARGHAYATRALVPVAQRPNRGPGHWADYPNSIKAGAETARAYVSLGAKKSSWILGANFGSIRFRQFPPVESPDHAVYKAIGEKREESIKHIGDAVMEIAALAFPGRMAA